MTRRLVLLLVFAAFACAAPPKKARTAEAGYVGTEGCLVCHEEIGKDMAKTRHGLLDLDAKQGWKGIACESCHGPGQKHAEEADPKLIVQPTKLGVPAADSICLDCHKGQATHAGRITSSHGQGQVSCVSCHTVHHKPGAILRTSTAKVNQMCSSCHADTRAEFQRPHAHALPQNAITCVDCHNPHGTHRVASLAGTARSNNNEPGCLRCHAEKRGPFAFEHAPVRLEGCAACHEPHGSNNPRMLNRADIVNHCLECHSNLPTDRNASGTLGTVATSFHDLRSPMFRNCTTCHVKIHGSHVNRDFLK